jgi:NAD(P)-dependent dehydrogenase (short-subunit alcohol dehydrogenase family)
MTDYAKAFRLDGKVALVSGGARGIGAAICEALGACGAAVLVTDVLEGPARETVERIRKTGGKADFQKLDVTDEGQWEAAVAAAQSKLGGLHILVNNAGIETAQLIAHCEASDFKRVMDVNVNGVFYGLKHAVRVMKPGGSIINMSSVAGIIGTTAHVAYHTSKGAVRLMTKAAAVECAALGTGIRVNSIHPAIVQTDMGTNFVKDFVNLKLAPDYAAAEAAIKGIHPMGFGQPSDVACAVVYLASEAAKWITGSELVVDGGLTAA